MSMRTPPHTIFCQTTAFLTPPICYNSTPQFKSDLPPAIISENFSLGVRRFASGTDDCR